MPQSLGCYGEQKKGPLRIIIFVTRNKTKHRRRRWGNIFWKVFNVVFFYLIDVSYAPPPGLRPGLIRKLQIFPDYIMQFFAPPPKLDPKPSMRFWLKGGCVLMCFHNGSWRGKSCVCSDDWLAFRIRSVSGKRTLWPVRPPAPWPLPRPASQNGQLMHRCRLWRSLRARRHGWQHLFGRHVAAGLPPPQS